MLVKPRGLLNRSAEWEALSRFVERRQRLVVVYGPRRVGKSFLLDALCRVAGGLRYQAITGVAAAQVDDFGSVVGDWLGVGRLRPDGWPDALDRLARVRAPFVVIDELPYLLDSSAELAGSLQRYVDAGDGPALIVSGSATATVADLLGARAPLYGRAAAVVVPAPFTGRDLARLWRQTSATSMLWIDAAIGGLPGYRPLLDPPGADLDGWMTGEVLAPSSPLLDAAEAALGTALAPRTSGVFVTLLRALARGERTYTGLARASGLPAGALSRPLAALERAGLVNRVPDLRRSRRDLYDLADPHLRMWLSLIEPNRSALQAGRSRDVWRSVRATTWPSQVLGPRWESVVRQWVAGSDAAGSPQRVGWTALSDRAGQTVHELDVVGVSGSKVVVIGEAKLRRLGRADLDRLRGLRDRLGAPDARLVMASASAVEIPRDAADVVRVTPQVVYG